MDLRGFYQTEQWDIVATRTLPGRDRQTTPVDDLTLSEPAARYVRAAAPSGVYKHQQEALLRACQGHHVCIATGTASGKSLVFYATALDHLASDASAKTIALYPLKALGRQQEQRWQQALDQAGVSCTVGRIDGGVPTAQRPQILRDSSVVTMTPDVMHAWLLPNVHRPEVRSFLRGLKLVVVDEVHTYTGVFGSNAAFLFRRLQHLIDRLHAQPCYICASATIAEPEDHLRQLFGFGFHLVGPEADTSPRHPLTIELVQPLGDPFTELPKLMTFLSAETDARFITFVDSRKQTEQLSAIAARAQLHDGLIDDHLRELDILPYRAGYEERDRQVIQERLVSGSLSGVVSTSALELGIDIPQIDTGILLGVPASSTALSQRIGRVGRHCPGHVVVLKAGGIYDEAVFRNPDMLFARPPTQGALYLENPRIQYIHTLCIARQDGEHDAITGTHDAVFQSQVDWPPGFMDLCGQERLGEVPPDLRSMKQEAGEDPAHTFPLRDVESQFVVEQKRGREVEHLGSLSHGQVMREAYPGAVYYYTTRPFRVTRVRHRSRTIEVRPEKHYTTRPQMLPTMVFPNLTEDSVLRAKRYGDLVVAECNLQIREAVSGFRERRGPNEFTQNYPVPPEHGIYFDFSRFTRNYFTTGTVFTHPSMSQEGVRCADLASLLFEATLITIPFERQDVSFAADRHRTTRGPLAEGAKFVAIYDQTYGSLRLSGRLLDDGVLGSVMEHLAQLVSLEDCEADAATIDAAMALIESSREQPRDCVREFLGDEVPQAEDKLSVILPKSSGLYLDRGNVPFIVADVFFSPRLGTLCYRGKLEGSEDKSEDLIVPVDHIVPIPGVSVLGLYDLETGQLEQSR